MGSILLRSKHYGLAKFSTRSFLDGSCPVLHLEAAHIFIATNEFFRYLSKLIAVLDCKFKLLSKVHTQ